MIDVARPAFSHSVSVTPHDDYVAVDCSCGWRTRVEQVYEAQRLGHAHLAYPDSTAEELRAGPRVLGEGV